MDREQQEAAADAQAWAAWDRFTLRVREHRDTTVRLHGGPRHGQIITIPRKLSRLMVRPVPDLRAFWETGDPGPPPAPILYERATLNTYDDVDHAVDRYDYWHAAGTPLPLVGRRPWRF